MNEGSTFGAEGEGFMRMNVGCPLSTLKKALEQLLDAYNELINNK
jgi:cystathionine beta-lyase